MDGGTATHSHTHTAEKPLSLGRGLIRGSTTLLAHIVFATRFNTVARAAAATQAPT